MNVTRTLTAAALALWASVALSATPAQAACPVGTVGVSGLAAVGPCYSLVGDCARVKVYYDLVGTHGDPEFSTCP